VLVGVSGGADSVALLHLLKEFGAFCHAVHVNYGLRGGESDGDASFVEELCARLGVPLEMVEVPEDWDAATSGDSIQERAREFRYRVFEDVADRTGIRKVAVAHHLDDQAETVLLRLLRGTGLQGAVGMRPKRPISAGSDIDLIRPLLRVSRSEILAWLEERGLDYRDDSSNADPRYARARLRRDVVPAIVEAFGDSAVRNIARFSGHARAAIDWAVMERLEGDLESALVEGAEPALSVETLAGMEPGWRDLVLLEALKRWMPDAPERSTAVFELATLLEAEPGKKVVFGNSVAWRSRESIVFLHNEGSDQSEYRLTPGEPLQLEKGTIALERDVSDAMSAKDDPDVEIADARLLDRIVTVGPWREGERFQPLGLAGTKTVSDFLRDERVAPQHKSNVLVVRSGGDIVWVVGHRLAHPYRITEETTEVVRLTWMPKGEG
jgi:tRNA(Ile)-lysidine synthase